MVQETSLSAFFDIQNDNLGLGQRQLIVYSALVYLRYASNAMIAKHLRLPINCVTPRIFELRQKGFVDEAHKDICAVTNRNVIFWKIKEKNNTRATMDKRRDLRSYNQVKNSKVKQTNLDLEVKGKAV